MFAQQSNQISPFNQRMDNQGKKSVFQRSENSPFFGQNTGNQNQTFSSAPQSVFGNKPATNYKRSLVFQPEKNDNQNQNSVFFGQQINDNQNRMFPNQRGRGRGRGNAVNNNSNRGRKPWGYNNQPSFNQSQHQNQKQPQQPSFQPLPVQHTPPAAPQQPRQKRQHQAQRQMSKPQQTEQSNTKQVTAAERAKRFGSTDKSDLYNQVSNTFLSISILKFSLCIQPLLLQMHRSFFREWHTMYIPVLKQKKI